jgi:hypothetical protein
MDEKYCTSLNLLTAGSIFGADGGACKKADCAQQEIVPFLSFTWYFGTSIFKTNQRLNNKKIPPKFWGGSAVILFVRHLGLKSAGRS